MNTGVVHDRDEPDQAKLEPFGALQDLAAVLALQEACGKRIDELFEQHREANRTAAGISRMSAPADVGRIHSCG